MKYNNDYDLGLTIHTKESMKKYLKTAPPHDMILIDEIHFMSGTTSDMHKTLVRYIKYAKPERIYGATATAYRSTPWNVYAYYAILYDNNPLSYNRFRVQFFKQVKMGARIIWQPDTSPRNTGALKILLEDICHTIEVPTGIPVHEYIKVPITFRPPKKYTSANDIYRVETMHPNMLQALNDLVEPGTVIVCYYREEVAYFKKLYECPAISGMSGDEYKMEYEDVDKYPVIVIQADSGTGFQLKYHHKMVFVSRSYSYVSYDQCVGRISRIDNFKKNYYYYLIPYYTDLPYDTVAVGVDKAITKKEDFKPEFHPYVEPT